MTIQEIKKEKSIMEDKLYSVIKEFIDRTGIVPEDIEIRTSVVDGFGENKTELHTVHAKVSI